MHPLAFSARRTSAHRIPLVLAPIDSLRTYLGHSSHVMCIRFSPDNFYVVSMGGDDRSAMQWRVLPVAHDDVVVDKPMFSEYQVYQPPKKAAMILDDPTVGGLTLPTVGGVTLPTVKGLTLPRGCILASHLLCPPSTFIHVSADRWHPSSCNRTDVP